MSEAGRETNNQNTSFRMAVRDTGGGREPSKEKVSLTLRPFSLDEGTFD